MATEDFAAGQEIEASRQLTKLNLATAKFSLCNIYDLQGGVMPAGDLTGKKTATIGGFELRRPFLDGGDLSTHDYYNFVVSDEEDGVVQLVRVTHSGEIVVVFHSVQFIAFTDEVLFFRGKSPTDTMQYGNLIKGKSIPATNKQGSWAIQGETENVDREHYEQWLEKVKPTFEQVVQWLVCNASFSKGEVALFKMMKIQDPMPAGTRLATGEEVQANIDKLVPLFHLAHGSCVWRAKLADGFRTERKGGLSTSIEVEKDDASEVLEFQLVIFDAEPPANWDPAAFQDELLSRATDMQRTNCEIRKFSFQ